MNVCPKCGTKNMAHRRQCETCGYGFRDRVPHLDLLATLGGLFAQPSDALVPGKISMGHARALINAPDEATQVELMREIVAKNLSVRKVEKLAKERAAGGKPKSAPSKPST
ncbi:MAG: hypothetical protein GF419_09385, partial [Ignavibacteriales bacterium]|nr:hypothetical protein [Ignavibacteriales bacterium]